MKNPFHRLTATDGTKVDVNLSKVSHFFPTGDNTMLVFADGNQLAVTESAQTVRGRTRKTWPDDAASAPAEGGE